MPQPLEDARTRIRTSSSTDEDQKTPGFSFGKLRLLLTDPFLRRRALLHWTLWAVAGFGWTGNVFFATFVSSGGAPQPHTEAPAEAAPQQRAPQPPRAS